MQLSFILFVFALLLMSPSAANAQSYNPPRQHDRCVRYDAHHRCVAWDRHGPTRVQVRVGGSPPPMQYDPYSPPSGYYDPYGYPPQQYGGQYGYEYGQPVYPQYMMQTQEALIMESEVATLARRVWEADRRAAEFAALDAQKRAEAQAEALRAQRARLQRELQTAHGQISATSRQLKATEAQLREAESILLMDDEPSQEGE